MTSRKTAAKETILKAASVFSDNCIHCYGLLFESKKRTSEWQISYHFLRVLKWLVHFTDPQSMGYHEWTTEMDYLNGRLNGLPKWNTLNYPP